MKMAPVVRRIYDQMLEPKYAISMGACCSSMGVFNNYALVPSDKFMPIDVHVPGCPPRPEALAHGILRLREKVQGTRRRAGASATTPSAPRRSSASEIGATSTSGSPSRGHRRCLTPTGLELIAQELRDADPESVIDTVFFRGRGDARGAPRHVRAVIQPCARRATTSSRACTAATTTRRAAARRPLRAARHARGRPDQRQDAGPDRRPRGCSRSSTSSPAPISPSARSTTCSASSSTAIRTCDGS